MGQTRQALRGLPTQALGQIAGVADGTGEYFNVQEEKEDLEMLTPFLVADHLSHLA